MIAYRRNRLTAWLGIFAMWLIVFAPIVSQGLVSRDPNTPFARICSADGPPGGGNHAHTIHLNACGYCDLLMHHVPAPSPALPRLQASQSYGVAQPEPVIAVVYRDVFPAARPRDSPFLV